MGPLGQSEWVFSRFSNMFMSCRILVRGNMTTTEDKYCRLGREALDSFLAHAPRSFIFSKAVLHKRVCRICRVDGPDNNSKYILRSRTN